MDLSIRPVDRSPPYHHLLISNVVRLAIQGPKLDFGSIHHKPTTGASTLALLVAWALRDEFPTALVTDLSDIQHTVTALAILYEKVGRPLAVFVDTGSKLVRIT